MAATTRERVESAIEELGYRPSRTARALRSQRQQFIGLVVPGSSDPFYMQLSQAVESEAMRHGYLTLTGSSGFDPDQELALVTALVDEAVAGVIVAGLGSSRDLHEMLESSPVRSVFLHHRPARVSGPLVMVDDRGWAQRATEHLLGHGYDRVAVLTHADDEGPVGERYLGWADAFRRCGRPVPEADVWRSSGYDRGSASRCAQAVMAAGDLPRAVFAATDELAFGLLHAAGKLGVRVPDDLAVIAFDGVDAAATAVPELATVQEPFAQLGARAVERLLAEDGSNDDEVLPCHLVPRRSCGC